MFLVGGGILVHKIPQLHHLVEPLLTGLNGFVQVLVSSLADASAGILAGAVVLAVVTLAQRMFKRGG
jgi:hypothetical protein